MRITSALAAIALVALSSACGRDPATPAAVTSTPSTPRAAADQPHEIVCTIGMVAAIVRAVTGERANVGSIIGEGVDPHLYKPTRSDVARLLEADIVFYSGLMLEGKMTDALVKVGRGKPVYAVTELIDESTLLNPPEFAGHADPHVWMDVQGWMRAVDAVALAMGEIDPDSAATYRANAGVYRAELEKLDAYAHSCIASIPLRSRVLITAHDAFNYFGRAYEIEVMGIQGISTESEAGLEDINGLVDLIVEREVRAVFVETSVADKNVRALVEGAESRGASIVIGGSLYSDAMGAPGTYEGTYIGMIDHNITTVTRALGGSAPARGLNGRLAVETKE